jgi:hypothetical protein
VTALHYQFTTNIINQGTNAEFLKTRVTCRISKNYENI